MSRESLTYGVGPGAALAAEAVVAAALQELWKIRKYFSGRTFNNMDCQLKIAYGEVPLGWWAVLMRVNLSSIHQSQRLQESRDTQLGPLL
jgi:hypothetical protein